MAMLAAYLRGQEREEAHKAFTAQMLWYLNSAMFRANGQKFEHPTWLDIAHPKQKDNRSGMEILDEVKGMLVERKRKKEQKGGK